MEVKTEGGHSYAAFGNRNAIFYLSQLIQTLYSMQPPKTGIKTSFNVGKISGGTSVNTIAQQAEMMFEYRSDLRENLDAMQKFFTAAVETTRRMVSEVNVEVIGLRPCMGEVDPIRQKAMEQRSCLSAQNILRPGAGIPPLLNRLQYPLFHGDSRTCFRRISR